MTIFDSFIATRVMRPVSLTILYLLRWKILGRNEVLPQKSVVVAYPHTGSIDLFYTILLAFALRLKVRVVAKRELFIFGVGAVLRFLGCVPVTRNGKLGTSEFLAEMINNAPNGFHLVIAPTGTRKKGAEWKTGFLTIAECAHVPIVLATVNARNKYGGIFAFYDQCGDREGDLSNIQTIYEKFLQEHEQKK